MKVLIAEDDPVSRRVLEATLAKWGHDLVVTGDGAAAWRALQGEDAPPLAVLDWMMPEMDGVEVCRRVREMPGQRPTYIILLTGKESREEMVTGLTAGADDYLTKPFDREELRARLHVGARVVALQQALAARVRELEQALAQVKRLQGLLPICAYCKKVRDDRNYWQQVETYVARHSEARFSHGVCPACWEEHVRPELEQLKASRLWESVRVTKPEPADS